MTNKLSHINEKGEANMVDVSAKPIQKRTASASGFISLSEETLKQVNQNSLKKGDVLSTARIAGIMAAKETSTLIPLCHPLQLSKVELNFTVNEKGIEAQAMVICTGQTGVEMEALTAVNVALLTIYDMCKAVDKGMVMRDIKLLSKIKE